MKIVFVITGLGLGGAERMLLRLTQGLAPDARPLVVSLTPIDTIRSEFDRAGVPVTTLGMTGMASVPRAVRTLARLLREVRPDVVNTWMYHADFVGGLAARLAGISAVAWNIRNSDLSPRHSPAATRALVRLNASISKRVPRMILCCSDTARRVHVDQGYYPGRFVQIPNGFDLERYAPDPVAAASVRRELSIADGASLIGLVARWHPQKNHRGFVDAAARLLRIRPDAHFLLVGSGVDAGNASLSEWIAEAGIGASVRLLGQRQDVPRLTAALDIATSSSTFGEAFPNVLGEAMACGVPCVATDIGDSANIVGDTGLIVPPADTAALSGAWERLLALSARERAALGARARERVSERFEMGAVRQRYLTVFEALASERRAPA